MKKIIATAMLAAIAIVCLSSPASATKRPRPVNPAPACGTSMDRCLNDRDCCNYSCRRYDQNDTYGRCP